LAASLGIASIGALASLAVYRDYFVGLAILALGYSFFVTFRKKYRAGLLSLNKYHFGRDDVLLVVTTLLVILAISFPYIRGVTLAQSGVSYEGRGSVVSLDEKGRKINLKHEEIKGLMPAMTMEFSVESTELLNGLRSGDRVRFTLIPQGGDFIVKKIEREGKQ
jgi:Cu/Ag efflux protein CusF